jgi:hypothetical protein
MKAGPRSSTLPEQTTQPFQSAAVAPTWFEIRLPGSACPAVWLPQKTLLLFLFRDTGLNNSA